MKEHNMQVQHRYLSSVHGSGHSGHFTDTIWRQFVMSPAKSYVLFSFIVVLLVGALVSTRLLDSAVSKNKKKNPTSSWLDPLLFSRLARFVDKTMSCWLTVPCVFGHEPVSYWRKLLKAEHPPGLSVHQTLFEKIVWSPNWNTYTMIRSACMWSWSRLWAYALTLFAPHDARSHHALLAIFINSPCFILYGVITLESLHFYEIINNYMCFSFVSPWCCLRHAKWSDSLKNHCKNFPSC